MGARLVAAAMSPDWAHLNYRDRLVLVSMSLTALDPGQGGDRESCLYYGGHVHLALGLTGRGDAAAQRTVRRCIAALVKAGAIRCDEGAEGRHERARYRITTGQPLIDTCGQPVDNSAATVDGVVDNVVPMTRFVGQ